MLTSKKDNIRPLIYTWAHEFWEMHEQAPWWHKRIDMAQDRVDWETTLSDKEKNVIGNILKGFAQTEAEVSNYWSAVIPYWFRISEVQSMAMSFGARERLHAEAYNYLNDILGLHDYEGFRKEPEIAARLEYLLVPEEKVFSGSTTLEEKAASVFTISICEGVNLFSAFSVLMSFKKHYGAVLSGVSEQMSWSVKDENMHSIAGSILFRTLCDENPGLKESVRETALSALKDCVNLEKNYVDKIFELGDIPSIDRLDVLNYLHYRANHKWNEAGYDGQPMQVDPARLKNMQWFDTFIAGRRDNDFFASHGSGYSVTNQSYDIDDLF